MKKTSIIAIIMIAVAIVILVMAGSDMSTYASFSDAAAKSGIDVKITGKLRKDKPIVYNPEIDANSMTFFMEDKEGIVKKVTLNVAKPQEFERSESMVLTGKMQNDQFIASSMLMKCPSKYKDEEIYIMATK